MVPSLCHTRMCKYGIDRNKHVWFLSVSKWDHHKVSIIFIHHYIHSLTSLAQASNLKLETGHNLLPGRERFVGGGSIFHQYYWGAHIFRQTCLTGIHFSIKCLYFNFLKRQNFVLEMPTLIFWQNREKHIHFFTVKLESPSSKLWTVSY